MRGALGNRRPYLDKWDGGNQRTEDSREEARELAPAPVATRTISWALKKRNLNAGRLVGFHRWRGRYFLGERVTRCGFDRQKGMRN